jgi:hypothetical protein
MRANHLRLVAIDGSQIAPAPRRPRGWNVRREREIRLSIIKEHLAHISHSMDRIKTLTGELESSLGISLGDEFAWPRPDALNPRPDLPA